MKCLLILLTSNCGSIQSLIIQLAESKLVDQLLATFTLTTVSYGTPKETLRIDKLTNLIHLFYSKFVVTTLDIHFNSSVSKIINIGYVQQIEALVHFIGGTFSARNLLTFRENTEVHVYFIHQNQIIHKKLKVMYQLKQQPPSSLDTNSIKS
jgi:hypothetical protein